MEMSKVFRKDAFLDVFREIAGTSAKILSEEEKYESGVLIRMIYTYTIYSEDYKLTGGPYRLTVLSAENDLSFILDASLD